MKLYEINAEIEKALLEAIDPETGEIKDTSVLESLNIAKGEKVKSIALQILNMESEEAEIDKALKRYLAMKKAQRRNIDKLRAYLKYHTEGQEYNFTEVKIKYLTSEETVITDKEAFEKYCKRHKDLFTYEIKPNKAAIKNAILSGVRVKGAEIVINKNLQIK